MYFVFNQNGNHGKGDTPEIALENLINHGDDFSMCDVEFFKAEKVKAKLTVESIPKTTKKVSK